ncbi:unnamed protein product [Durusdinium trenchii]|uniref:Uncharacterized protein n=1 Tax=Durusdinium trenchii TaxID=1381693 RepID=A0ABP0HCV4_9DINO
MKPYLIRVVNRLCHKPQVSNLVASAICAPATQASALSFNMVKQGSCAKTLDALGIEPPNRKLLSAALRKAAENTANVQFVEVRSEMMIKREHAASQGRQR